MMKSMLPHEVVRVASLLLESLGTPISLGVALRLRYCEWDGLAEISVDPRSYLDADRYARDAAAVGLLKKLKELPTSFDRRGAAIEKWWQGERDCFKTNERICRYLPENRLFDDRNDVISDFFSEVKKLITSWIGLRPTDLAEGRFGPGATYSDRGGRTTVPDKMSSDPSLTRDAVWYLPQWLCTQWGSSVLQRHGQLSFVPGNRYATVPKTCKTDRSIASEPSINVFYQLALGRQLRHCLNRRAGWNLDRAQEIHRRVACESSVSREFATLDLSNASDTVASNLVKLLLPRFWWEALDSLRSRKTLIDKKWVMLEKFSSMGNGFTFELETIIFAAIACVVSRKAGHLGILGVDVFVFGDDIIVKNDVVEPLLPVLRFCGFTTNKEKSFFASEPFRESCGGDYFAGKPVRPYNLKEIPNGPQDYVALANGLRALTDRLALTGSFEDRRAWFAVLDCIPSGIRSCRGPKDLGDIVIHDTIERWSVGFRAGRKIRPVNVEQWTARSGDGIRYLRALLPGRTKLVRFERFTPEVVLACATYGTGDGVAGGVTPRDAVLSYRVGWVPYS